MMSRLIAKIARRNEKQMAELQEMVDSMFVKSPMDDPEFIKFLDDRMSIVETSAKRSANSEEESVEVPEPIQE